MSDGHVAAARLFLALGTLGWLLLGYGIPLGLIATTRRRPSIDQANGTWFLWAVSSEPVAVAAATPSRQTTGHLLPMLAGGAGEPHDLGLDLHGRGSDHRARRGEAPRTVTGRSAGVALGHRWRHVLRRITLRYDFGRWNLVFPIGMYGVTTHEWGRTTETSW